MQVFVSDNNVDQALRGLKRKLQREGLFPQSPRRTPGGRGTARGRPSHESIKG